MEPSTWSSGKRFQQLGERYSVFGAEPSGYDANSLVLEVFRLAFEVFEQSEPTHDLLQRIDRVSGVNLVQNVLCFLRVYEDELSDC